jgi:hypothetical protein
MTRKPLILKKKDLSDDEAESIVTMYKKLAYLGMTPHRDEGQRPGMGYADSDLLAEAERAGFKVLLTADKNMRYQQNLTGRRIALVVLSTPQWPLVRLHLDIISAVNAATPGSYAEVTIPYE